ncbi:asparagine synthase C-terminal domain-containing protein, partial [Paracoccaceae bacterium]|nr:asparagine synthase C-terminal domain-containing protein [Paracoccaceae bacterium]
ELILGGLFTYFISKQAYKDGLKVLLFGEGADEVFGGYDKYQLAMEDSYENAKKMMFSDLNMLWLTHNNRVDHASMAASIEARVPYQDNYVTNNARNLPMELKVDNGNILRNKIALRKIAEKYLPNNIALRKKEVISRGTDLGFMLNKVSKKMASYYRVESISNSDRKNFNIESYIEAVAFKIWRKIFPNLAENIVSMKQRGLMKKISV